MKRLIPVLLYPYADIIVIVIFFTIVKYIDDPNGISTLLLLLFSAVYNLLVIGFTIWHTVDVVRGKYNYYEAAKMNLIVRIGQIVAYVLHLLLGVIGLALGVFGLGFLLWAIFVDVLTIGITGIIAIGCGIRLGKDGIMKKGEATICTICSFVFVVDIVMAFLFFMRSKNFQRLNGMN